MSLQSDSDTNHKTNGYKVSIFDSRFAAGSDADFVIRGAKVAVEAGQLSTTML